MGGVLSLQHFLVQRAEPEFLLLQIALFRDFLNKLLEIVQKAYVHQLIHLGVGEVVLLLELFEVSLLEELVVLLSVHDFEPFGWLVPPAVILVLLVCFLSGPSLLGHCEDVLFFVGVGQRNEVLEVVFIVFGPALYDFLGTVLQSHLLELLIRLSNVPIQGLHYFIHILSFWSELLNRKREIGHCILNFRKNLVYILLYFLHHMCRQTLKHLSVRLLLVQNPFSFVLVFWKLVHSNS